MDSLDELISRSMDAIAQGEAGFLTVMGMGCVFLALVALLFFMNSMGRFTALPKSSGQVGRAQTEEWERSSAPYTEEGDEAAELGTDQDRGQHEEEIAAAISVALSLQTGGMAPGLSIPPPSPTRSMSPWKITGRLTQLQRDSKR